MIDLRIILPLCSLLLFPIATSSAAAPPEVASSAARAFEHFKNLEGAWTGQSASGKSFEMTYELTGDGSSVLERSQIGGEHDMFTVYHLDGETLMLTHYCASGNQPRMRAADFSGTDVRFEFVDATGLASAADGHMHHAVFEFEGPDRFRTAWTWRENGSDAFTEAVELRRAAD